MAQTPEGKVKDRVKKIMDSVGAYYFPAATHGYGRSGVPDYVGCLVGRFFAVECKAGDNTTTALQDRELMAIERAGGFAMVVNELNQDLLLLKLRELKHGAVQ